MKTGDTTITTRPAALALALLAAVLALASCGRSSRPSHSPADGAKRVVSFSPAITQILFDMDLGDQVVGVTRFCKLPAGVRRTRVGDALSYNREAILATRPDVIFAQTDPAKFQGVRDVDARVRVVRLHIESLNDISAAMLAIGRELGCERAAREKANAFSQAIEAIEHRTRLLPPRRTIFVMGTDRPTAAGEGTFVSDMISACGGTNVGAAIPGQAIWRPTQIEAIVKVRPEVLICQVSPGKEQAARAYWMGWRDIPAVPAGRVHVVSDPDWSIPGTHLAGLLAKLGEMIHGELPAASTATRPASRPAEEPGH